MRRKLLAEEGEIILLEGGRCQGGIGIEESVELINDIGALMTCEPLRYKSEDHSGCSIKVPFPKCLAALLLYSFPLLKVFEEYWMLLRIASMYGTKTPSGRRG